MNPYIGEEHRLASRTRLDARIIYTAPCVDAVIHQDARTQAIRSRPSIICSIQRIPVELLMEIFLRVPRTRKPCSVSAPLLLCQICSIWRAVALRTPGLWSALNILFTELRIDHSLEMASAWLIRSGSAPISISVGLSPTNRYIPHNPLIDIVAPHSYRIRDLAVSLPKSFIFALLCLPAGYLDSLEELHLEVTSRISTGCLPDANNMLEAAPRLHKLTLFSWDVLQHYSLRLPWSQLTHLTICHIPRTSYLLQCLEKCACLLDCTLSFDIDGGDETATLTKEGSGKATLPMLKTLRIIFCEDEVSSLLCSLILPNLRHLQIMCSDTDTDVELCPWSQSTFLALQARSSFELVTLSLVRVAIKSEELIMILLNMPSLIRLELR